MAMGYESSFFGNVNIMLLIQLVVFLACIFVYLLSIKNPTFKTPHKYIQRTLLMIVVFNCINNMFSMSLISSAYAFDLALAALCAFMILGQLIHFCIYYKGYLGFEDTYDIHKVRFKTYFISLMLARIATAVVSGVLREDPAIAVSANLAIQGVLCIILTIIRPFKNCVMNGIMLVG
jgi:hypothetical protein